MDADEREIFYFLKTWGSEFVGVREICRRAGGKKKYFQDNDWAKPLLIRMHERGIIEHDSQGRYRIKPVPNKNKGNRWVSPDIAKILQESGVEIENPGDTAPDDYYDQL